MNRLLVLLALVGATIALTSSTTSAQFTPLSARISIVSDVTIHRTLGGEVMSCLAPPFNPSPNVALVAPEVGSVAYANRSVICEDALLEVEQRFEVSKLDDQPNSVSPAIVHVETTSYLTYAGHPTIKIGEDDADWDLTTGEFWIGHPVRNQPGVTFNSNHYVDTVNTSLVQ